VQGVIAHMPLPLMNKLRRKCGCITDVRTPDALHYWIHEAGSQGNRSSNDSVRSAGAFGACAVLIYGACVPYWRL
jgi:hypothetical protein